MRVEQLMSVPPATVAPGDSLHIADGIMSMGVVRHLPVVKDGELVGLVSQSDVLRSPALLAPLFGMTVDSKAALRALRVEDAKSSPVFTIGPDASIQDAAARLLDHRVGCLPVLEEGRLVGIVTTSDLLRAVAHSAPALQPAQLEG